MLGQLTGCLWDWLSSGGKPGGGDGLESFIEVLRWAP